MSVMKSEVLALNKAIVLLDLEDVKLEKYFIAFQDKDKRKLSVAIENGMFFLINKNRVEQLSKNEVLRIILLIKVKKYKLNGHGFYSKSILA